MGDGARLQDGGDPAQERLDGGQGGGQLVVVAGDLAVQRDGPVEDRLLGVDVLRDHAAYQRVGGGVLVGIDQARDDDAAARVEFGGAGEVLPQGDGGTDRGDAPAGDGDGGAGDHLPARRHRHHVPADDQQDVVATRSLRLLRLLRLFHLSCLSCRHGRTSTLPTRSR